MHNLFINKTKRQTALSDDMHIKREPKMTKWGFLVYPVYTSKGKLVYVSIPE